MITRHDRQFLTVRFKVRTADRDGYGIAEVAVPTTAVRWEGEPRSLLDVKDIFAVELGVSDRTQVKVFEQDLDT